MGFGMKHSFLGACIAAFVLLAGGPLSAAAPLSNAELAAKLDASISPMFKADAPGATIIVVREGNTMFRKAYGMADLDAKRALTPDMVLRLGSITKQFTATAILLLQEQGKLSLNDDIRQHLPDFPDKGKIITIEHRLTHTAGIPSYTSAPDYPARMAREESPAAMIARFKDLPLEFAPGEWFSYSNSGYFLLGAIIEKLGGVRYADFLADHVFEPLGMKHTAYEGVERHQGVAARGYSLRNGKAVPAAPLSMTQPYAAGSLISTVDDLARWDAAISAGKLLRAASWKRAFTPYKLSSGVATAYGYGWEIGELEGSPMIAHAGGINGFLTYAVRFPGEKVYVAVLTNSDAGSLDPKLVGMKLAGSAIGKPFVERQEIKVSAADLDALVGTYKGDGNATDVVFREGEQLFVQRAGGIRIALKAHSRTGFFIPGRLTLLEFGKNEKGEVDRLTVSDPGHQLVFRRTSARPPAARLAVQLAPGVFERYVGKYELAPGFVLDVMKQGDRFMAQATGQGAFEIFAESDVLFFATVVDAQARFEFVDGKVVRLVWLQGGREVAGRRM